MWHPEMCFIFLSPFFHQFPSLSGVSQLRSPSNPTTHFSFCFLLTADFLTHICISLFPCFPSFFFFIKSSVSVSCSLWSLCKICAETGQPVTLLLWDDPWSPRLWHPHPHPFSLLSQLQPYLSTQPYFFSSLNTIIPTKVHHREHVEVTGVSGENKLTKIE